jgi:hypothetical protein
MYVPNGRERLNNGDHEIMVFFKEKDWDRLCNYMVVYTNNQKPVTHLAEDPDYVFIWVKHASSRKEFEKHYV